MKKLLPLLILIILFSLSSCQEFWSNNKSNVTVEFDSAKLAEIVESFLEERNAVTSRSIGSNATAILEVICESQYDKYDKALTITSTDSPLTVSFNNIQNGLLIQLNARLIVTIDNEEYVLYKGDTSFISKTGELSISLSMKKETSSVKFNANGGSGEIADQVFDCGMVYELPTNTFTRNGYTFEGWATTSDAKAVEYAEKADYICKNEDVTFYAVWTPIVYKIEYSYTSEAANFDYSFETLSPTTYTIEDTVILPWGLDYTTIIDSSPSSAIRGWFESEEISDTDVSITEIPEGSTGDKTFYADWASAVKISFMYGELMETQTFFSGIPQKLMLINEIFPDISDKYTRWMYYDDLQEVCYYEDGEEITIDGEEITIDGEIYLTAVTIEE